MLFRYVRNVNEMCKNCEVVKPYIFVDVRARQCLLHTNIICHFPIHYNDCYKYLFRTSNIKSTKLLVTLYKKLP